MNINGVLYQLSMLTFCSSGPVKTSGSFQYGPQDSSFNTFIFTSFSQKCTWSVLETLSPYRAFFSVIIGAFDVNKQHAAQYIIMSSCFSPWELSFPEEMNVHVY